MISGFGLASAITSGWSAIDLTMSGVSTLGADSPRKISAPPITSAIARACRSSAHRPPSSGPSACCGPRAPRRRCRRPRCSCAARPARPARFRHAIAAAPAPEQTIFTSGSFLPFSSSALAIAAADDDGGAVLVVVEHRDLHALLELRLDLEALRALDVLQVDAAEGRLQRRDASPPRARWCRRRFRCRTRRCRRIS